MNAQINHQSDYTSLMVISQKSLDELLETKSTLDTLATFLGASLASEDIMVNANHLTDTLSMLFNKLDGIEYTPLHTMLKQR